MLNLEHHLDVLEHQPGALLGRKPLAQWGKLGRWPASFDESLQGLIEKHGRHRGTRELIELLLVERSTVGRRCGAVKKALTLGCAAGAAVRHLLAADQLEPVVPMPVATGELIVFERPLPTINQYIESQRLAPRGR